MKSDIVWQIRVLTVVLLTHSSQANKACPSQLTNMSNFPVIRMCENQSTTGAQGLYLDAFVPANTSTTCRCSLQATQAVSVGVNGAELPKPQCVSSLTVKQSPRPIIYTCKNGGNSSVGRTLEKEWNMTLRTIATEKDIEYCINLYITSGSGYLSIQCYPSRDSSGTPSTRSSTTGLTADSVKSSPHSLETTESKSTDMAVTMKTSLGKETDDFPVAAVAGGVGGVVLIAVLVIIVVVFFKRKRRNKRHGHDSDNDGGYCNMDADPYKHQNTKSSGRHSGDSADQNLTGNQTIRSPSDDYASIDDKDVGSTRKPQVALKPNWPNTNDHDDFQPQPDHDDVSNMYAKVNKNKKPAKSVNEAAMPVMHVNELYAVVDKTKKGKQPLKAKASGDVYAVVKKPKKSGGKSSEPKGQGPESEITGDVYTEVRKPKKPGTNPITPKGSPGLIYTEVEFDENTDEPQEATRGDEKTDSVATEEDRVLYSKVC